jgi:hypothetical protein
MSHGREKEIDIIRMTENKTFTGVLLFQFFQSYRKEFSTFQVWINRFSKLSKKYTILKRFLPQINRR